MPHKSDKKAKHGKGKKGDAPVKGLKGSLAPPHSPAKGKSQPSTDPTKGLRDAIKAKEIQALALQAASLV